MIHVEQHGPVVAIRMSRSFLGRPFWWTAAYWVDGVLMYIPSDLDRCTRARARYGLPPLMDNSDLKAQEV